jgi:Na+/H+-dicarboxylate symporter
MRLYDREQPDTPWRTFRVAWRWMFFGLFVGFYLGVMAASRDPLKSPEYVVLVWQARFGLWFIAIVPDMVAQMVRGIRRYRSAVREQAARQTL